LAVSQKEIMKILVINGPNINMLGIREPDLYGKRTYKSLCDYITCTAEKYGIEVEIFQSNHEGAIVDRIQQAYFEKIDGIIINPAAYTHTSIAILDALLAATIPTVEVHLTAIYKRDEFRHRSYISKAAIQTITGKGFEGYEEAFKILLNTLQPLDSSDR